MTDKAEPEKSDPPPEGGAENEGKPDLESLLASFNKGTDKGPEKPADLSTAEQLKELRKDLADRDYRETMDDVVLPTLKGELEVPDDYVEYWINKQVEAEPRLLDLWDARKQNPGAFKEAIGKLAPDFQESVKTAFGKDDKSNDQKLLSTVRGSRESDSSVGDGFDDVDWPSLGDQDFELKKRDLFRAVESGAAT